MASMVIAEILRTGTGEVSRADYAATAEPPERDP